MAWFGAAGVRYHSRYTDVRRRCDPGEADLVTLIRPPTIRGQLRFWWRATCGAASVTLLISYGAKIEVWGDTRVPAASLLKPRFATKARSSHVRSFRLERDSLSLGEAILLMRYFHFKAVTKTLAKASTMRDSPCGSVFQWN